MVFHGVGGVGGEFRFLNGYGELQSAEPANWAAELGVPSSGALGEGMVSIVSISAMFFNAPFRK